MFIKLLNEWVYYLFNGLLAFYCWVMITTNGVSTTPVYYLTISLD